MSCTRIEKICRHLRKINRDLLICFDKGTLPVNMKEVKRVVDSSCGNCVNVCFWFGTSEYDFFIIHHGIHEIMNVIEEAMNREDINYGK